MAPGYGLGVPRTILLNKPYDVVTRFTLPANAKAEQLCLADVLDVPGVYPVGRLDRDSEGLLLLSSERRIISDLLDPVHAHERIYLAQVEGVPGQDALAALQAGVVLDGVVTRPARAELIEGEPPLWPRTPPIRYRAAIPTSWIELGLIEGRNRQVRRMTAAVGFPTLRLVRWSILHLTVSGLAPGEWRDLDPDEAQFLREAVGTPSREAPVNARDRGVERWGR